ncbi:calcium and integrin-binding protein 1-like [Agrilus planipennis]|uniref:Calcium and integrin-binding protein 1-like n=1 Tax=Agrilus planipennis TaxID=224129 RepID=A0A1W4XAQ7_AGRPL|nr:calcium and integrin-binding protein 1-like [Agrilus planipennis]
MGSSNSVQGITEYLLDEYTELTFLTRAEILYLFKQFRTLAPRELDIDIYHRVPVNFIKELCPQLKYNPFRDRIFRVFSSCKDEKFSFEDLLDLYSVMSENCPDSVKAAWAFKILDFDDDGEVGEEDLYTVIDRLTKGNDPARVIDPNDKHHIVSVILKELDLQSNGCIGRLEFEHAVGKMSEFPSSFSFRT